MKVVHGRRDGSAPPPRLHASFPVHTLLVFHTLQGSIQFNIKLLIYCCSQQNKWHVQVSRVVASGREWSYVRRACGGAPTARRAPASAALWPRPACAGASTASPSPPGPAAPATRRAFSCERGAGAGRGTPPERGQFPHCRVSSCDARISWRRGRHQARRRLKPFTE